MEMSAAEEATNDPRAEFVAGLRAMADWFDQHTEFNLPYCVDGPCPARFSIGIFPSEEACEDDRDDTPERFAAAVKALGGDRQKEVSDTAMRVTRTFGPGLNVDVWATRERVCEAVVVGTKRVEVEKVITPAVTEKVIEQQDVIRWRCAPVLESAS